MFVRITQSWQATDFPEARLGSGQVFCVRPSLAVYLFAMQCAEVAAPRAVPATAEPRLLMGVGALLFGALLWRQRFRTAPA